MFNKIIKEYDLYFVLLLVILNLVIWTYRIATGLGGKKVLTFYHRLFSYPTSVYNKLTLIKHLPQARYYVLDTQFLIKSS